MKSPGRTPEPTAVLSALLAILLLPGAVWAATSTNYTLPTADLNNGAGSMSSANYRLSHSLGAVVGGTPVSGGGVALGGGLIAQIDRPAAALSAGSLNFGAQGVTFTSPPLLLTITNRGVAPLNISTVSAAGDFTVAASTCSGAALATQASCSISITFTPAAVSARIGSLTIASNGAIPAVSLGGSGVLNVQVITLGAPPNLLVGGSGSLAASASSGLTPIVLASATPAICTISGNDVTGAGAGICTINASQAGNGVWAATATSTSFSVAAAGGDVPLPGWALGLLGASLVAMLRRRAA
jgi:hypothetical protein